MSIYNTMDNIELKRQQDDLLYHIFVNTKTDTLNDVCGKIAEILSDKYKDPSIRLQNMIQRVQQTSDRVSKHGFLLFALNQEPGVRDLFLSTEAPRVPPNKFTRFVEHDLPDCVNKLLTGSFTSLRAFVEDARWRYYIL